MARKPKQEKIENIYQVVQQHPGSHPSFIARLLGLNRSEVTRNLPNLEVQGYLISEDHQGGLWPFTNKDK